LLSIFSWLASIFHWIIFISSPILASIFFLVWAHLFLIGIHFSQQACHICSIFVMWQYNYTM
jgi:hypothetical protein